MNIYIFLICVYLLIYSIYNYVFLAIRSPDPRYHYGLGVVNRESVSSLNCL